MRLSRAQKIYAACLSVACFALFNVAAVKRLSPGEARVVKRLPAAKATPGAAATRPSMPHAKRPWDRLPDGTRVTVPATTGEQPVADIINPPFKLCAAANGRFAGDGFQPGQSAWLDTVASCNRASETWCYITFINSLWIWDDNQQKYVLVANIYPYSRSDTAPYCGVDVSNHFQVKMGNTWPIDRWFVMRTEIWDMGSSPHAQIFVYDFEFQNTL